MKNRQIKRVIDYFSRERLLWLLLWIVAISVFAIAKNPGGMDVDSCNYAVVAKEILRSGNWLNLYDPVYQGVFYYHFPLTIWITAILFKLFGASTFVAKLFSMFSCAVLVFAIYYFGKILIGRWAGFFAGLAFLFTNHVIRLSMQCRMDIPVSMFITLALLFFFLAQYRAKTYYLLFGLFTCFAIFTKDAVGIFPLAIAVIYLMISGKWREIFGFYFISGILISFLPVVFWVWLDKATLFIPWFKSNFLHLLSSESFRLPWYYYIEVILKKYFYLLPFALGGIYLSLRKVFLEKRQEFLLLIVWVLIFPVAFSFARQKLHYFIMPMYPAAALLCGICLNNIFGEKVKEKIASFFKYSLFLGTFVMLCFPLHFQSKQFKDTAAMAPLVDEILKNTREYDFIVYRQDVASILFYSQELPYVYLSKDEESLQNKLADNSGKRLFLFISEKDYLNFKDSLKNYFVVLLRKQDKLLLTGKNSPYLHVSLP